jgi:hypothetical protein
MTTRLPSIGGDDNSWGTVLNDFLLVSHNDDGTMQTNAVQGAGGVTTVNGKTPSSGTVTLTASDVGAPILDTTASDIQPLGTQTAGSTGKAADASHVHPTTGIALLSGATFTGYVAPSVVGLTFGGSIVINAALGNDFVVTLTSNTGTLANPTNPTDRQIIRVDVIQDATGSRTLAYGSAYDFGAAGVPSLSTGANKIDTLAFRYIASIVKWTYIGSGLGF